MATTNVAYSLINNQINKSVVAENNLAQFVVFKQKSRNFYLNIINRSNSKDILYIVNKNIIHSY